MACLCQKGYENIATIPRGMEDRAYTLAVAEDETELLQIINQGIGQIDESRMQSIILSIASTVEREVSIEDFLSHYWKEIVLITLLIMSILDKVRKKLMKL